MAVSTRKTALVLPKTHDIAMAEIASTRIRRVGRHRRILFEDILKYKEKSKEKSRKVREELTRDAQDLDLGY